MSAISNEELLAKWLDKQLNQAEQQTFEQRYVDDPSFASRVDSANRAAFETEQYSPATPPAWDKTQTIAFSRRASRPSWSWMPTASMAMSVVAMLMVISGFEVRSTDDQLQIGFNLAPDQQQIAAIVDDKLTQYQQSNQTLMAQYIDALQSQNDQSRTELTRFLIETSREERREDFAELIKFINEQREDDQRFYARQFNKLEAELYSASFQE